MTGMLHDPEAALEVTQEAFIKAYRALPRFRGDSAFYTWLYRIAINTAKNHLVARSRRPPSVDVDVDDADFRALFSGSPIKRTGRDRFVRNVLIAIANSGDQAMVETISERLDDMSPVVRETALWALKRLNKPT